MKLWMVTWELDLTQFLLEAKTEFEAIHKAIAANKKLEPIDDDFDRDMEDAATYSVDPVDMEMLCDIVKRTDLWDVVEDVVCYVGG